MITLNLPMAEYLAMQAVSASDLITMDAECPAKAWAHSALNPRRLPRRDTEATILGTAAHMAILEPEKFDAAYAFRPLGMDGRTKEGRAWKEEQGDRIVMDHDDATAIALMRSAVAGHPLARAALRHGQAEAVLTWTDAETGLACKARPDYKRAGMACDLKTAISAQPDVFGRQAANLRYYIRAAWGVRAMRECGEPGARYAFIAVEKEPPCPVIVAAYDEDAMAWADIQIRAALRRFADCLAAGKWPGYSDDRVVTLELPVYTERELQRRHERGDFTPPPRPEFTPETLMAG